ncbi:MAG TPA: FAD-dependent oxidoreductase [Candidatus Saccharimonadales bacterium]|nr:FAD-dependent oxidoreductase [Candidatus Saccharimonadales bacterium]
MKLKLAKKELVASNIMTFWFEPEIQISRIAGQYTQLYIPHPDMDERKDKRWFTISSSPTEKLWSVTTKLDPVRKSTFKTTLLSLKPDDIINAQLPMGDFVLPKDTSLPLVFVAGGIGITPYRSILQFLSDTKEKRDITLIYAVNETAEIAFSDIIKASGVKFISHAGRLNSTHILDYVKTGKDRIIYLSGPEHMVENLQKGLLSAGIKEELIRTDFFHNYD